MEQTEHNAVNDMLIAIGSTPVNEGSTNADTIIASAKLVTVKATVLTKGWWFNTEKDWPLAPNGSNNILLPPGTLEVDPSDPTSPYVQRGRKLYDRENRTFTFTSSVKVELIQDMNLEDLPAVAYLYIVARAAREMHVRIDGDLTKLQDLRVDEQTAEIELKKAQLRNADVNLLNSPMGQRMLQGVPRPKRL